MISLIQQYAIPFRSMCLSISLRQAPSSFTSSPLLQRPAVIVSSPSQNLLSNALDFSLPFSRQVWARQFSRSAGVAPDLVHALAILSYLLPENQENLRVRDLGAF